MEHYLIIIIVAIIVAYVVYHIYKNERKLILLDKFGGFYVCHDYNTEAHDLSMLSFASRHLIVCLEHMHKDIPLTVNQLLKQDAAVNPSVIEYTKRLKQMYKSANVTITAPISIVETINGLAWNNVSGDIEFKKYGRIRATGHNPQRYVLHMQKLMDTLSSYPREVYLILRNAPKYFPNIRPVVFKREFINSAEYHRRSRHLYITRTEEFQKVALHELLHALDVEIWCPQYSEAIVETLARYINVVLASKDNCTFNYLWKMEILFGLYQTAKIRWVGEEVGTPDASGATNVLEYYIYTTAFMIWFNKFYEAYINHDQEGLAHIIENVFKNESYISIIDHITNDFKTGYIIDKDLFRTARMAVTEITI